MIDGILDVIKCALIDVLNLIIEYGLDTIVFAIAWAIAILPSLPFESVQVAWGTMGNSIGYFIPISQMLSHFSLMLGIMVIWYSVQHIMRLVKLIK